MPRLLVAAGVTAIAAACASSPSMSSIPTSGPEAPVAPVLSVRAPSPDPRVGLATGWRNAGEAIWNMRMVSTTPPSEKFISPSGPGDQRFWQSDLAFDRNYVAQGNFSGFQVWDVSNPARPALATAYVCPGSQVDVSLFRNLLFMSHEATSGRVDCGIQGVPDSVSKDRARGIRIYDVSDMRNPKMLTIVQTCRGSHTHTVVEDPKDSRNVYIYVSGSAGVRSPNELPGCSALYPAEDANSSLFRIEIIRVPLANPAAAHIVSTARIFDNLAAPPSNPTRDVAAGGRGGRGGGRGGRGAVTAANDSAARAAAARAALRPPGPNQCHDITVDPAIGLAGGACGGYGLLLDISNVTTPRRIGAAADSNFAFWHSATFNNDGSKVLFTDEWGGGTAARCRVTDRPEWGANAIFTIDAQREMHFQSYYKLPAPQTAQENCVAHNGSLIPVPGRDIMVQGWYQGGISVFDWTDAKRPTEIAFHDRGPIDTVLATAGSWSAYWYNGYIYSSEIGRGLDVLELTPSEVLTQNEIDAAKTVRFAYLNPQGQPKITWPASFAMSKAFVDQLERTRGLGAGRLASVRSEIAAAERLSGDARKSAVKALARSLQSDVSNSADRGKLRMLIASLNDLGR
ncbi:MAG TPA: hypothetical protein VFO55_01535 [Gemmatimonadaceae bacterium]|nr:hypothetical protein [Gemmatimonadaceae bacterium]